MSPEEDQLDKSVEVGSWTKRSIDPRFVGPFVAALAVLAAVAVWTGFRSESPSSDTEEALVDPGEDGSGASPVGDDFPGVAPDGRVSSDFPSQPWEGQELLIAFNNSSQIDVFDLSTGARSSWLPPDPLLEETPLTVGAALIVVTESGAYARVVGAGSAWAVLGEADRVKPSTKADRVWLRTPVAKVTGLEADFLWTEVDLEGVRHRSINRTDPLDFPTPELVWGLIGGIFRFDDEPVPQWRLMSDFARPVAVGKNHVISRECTTSLVCRRVWYDTTDGSAKGPLFSDLAKNIDVDHDALLSDDGRFVASENERGGAEIYSIATKQRLANNCVWSGPIEWTTESDLLACRSLFGLEVYEANLGINLGLALGEGEFAPLFTFVPNAPTGLSQLSRSTPRAEATINWK